MPNGHTKNAALVYLSPRRKDPARVTTSICAQCHVRTGTAKSTGRPYANNFVAGDNLFRDFQVDLSDAAIAGLDPGDSHVLANVRDVVLLGKEKVTCVSCHDVHKQSTRKHHVLPQTAQLPDVPQRDRIEERAQALCSPQPDLRVLIVIIG